MDLPLEDSPAVVHQLSALQLVTGHHEDFNVDHQHDEQRGQDTPKEVEVHHVAHGDHVLKETLYQAAASIAASIPGLCAVGGTVLAVPAQKRGQPNAKGKDPEASNDASCPGPRDQTLIPVRKKIIRYCQFTVLCKSSGSPLTVVTWP